MTLADGELIEFVKSFEEVDTAMFDRLQGVVIDGEPVEVTFYTPDVDLVDLDPPSIVLYRTSPVPDWNRWRNDKIRDNFVRNAEGDIIEMDIREYPTPYNIMYTVKTIYTQQMDGVVMNDWMMRAFKRGDFITINGINYDVDMTSSGLWGAHYKDFGRVENGTRKFQETFAFTVKILMDVHERNTYKTVREVIPTIQ